MSQSHTVTCSGCAFLRVWDDPKPHDLAPQGCMQPRWAGYVGDVNHPPCGGLEFTSAPVSDSQEGGL